MRVVYKYKANALELALNGSIMRVREGRVVHVAAQRPEDDLPTVWIEHKNPQAGDRTMDLAVIGTGHEFPDHDDSGFEHVGSAVCDSGSLVWHVYKRALS